MKEEWGPWIEHDGKGCHVLGMVVRVLTFEGEERVVIAGAECREWGNDPNGPKSAWVWDKPAPFHPQCVREYQIKKPKGLTILEGVLSSVPKKEDWHKQLEVVNV